MTMPRLRERAGGFRTKSPWGKWMLLSAVLVLLSAPFLLDLNIPGESYYGGTYRAPTAVTGPRLPDKAAYVGIRRSGQLWISDGDHMSLPVADENELRTAVEYVTASFPGRPFILKIDKDTRYEKVDRLVSLLRSAGVRMIYFHTELPASR